MATCPLISLVLLWWFGYVLCTSRVFILCSIILHIISTGISRHICIFSSPFPLYQHHSIIVVHQLSNYLRELFVLLPNLLQLASVCIILHLKSPVQFSSFSLCDGVDLYSHLQSIINASVMIQRPDKGETVILTRREVYDLNYNTFSKEVIRCFEL